MRQYLILGGIGLFILSIITIGMMWVGYSNQEVKLRNNSTAQEEVCEAHFDKMWKVIKQKAQVTEEYKSTFMEVYPELMSGRYGNDDGGAFMKWIQEDNPDFDVSLYKDLMVAIEAQRESFFDDQKRWIDIKLQHDNLLATIPSKWFVGSRPELVINIIKSETTEAVYSTGQENDIELFE